VAIVSLRPIENCEHLGGRDRIDGLTCRNRRRIFFARQLTDRIVIGKGLRKWNRHKVKSRIGGDLWEKIDRFSDHTDKCGEITRLELFQGGGVVKQDLLHLATQPPKNNPSPHARSASPP